MKKFCLIGFSAIAFFLGGTTQLLAVGLDPETTLLIRSETVNGDRAFNDSSNYDYSVSTQGSGVIQHSTNEARFGASSIHFDGAWNNAMVVDRKAGIFGSGDFTIDAWVYSPSTATGSDYIVAFNYHEGEVYYSYAIIYSPSSQTLSAFASLGSWKNFYHTYGSMTQDAWHHIAFIRNGTTLSLYVDGISQDSITVPSDPLYIHGSANLVIGNFSTNPTTSNDISWEGYMEDFRISKVARWTSDFTPPIRPFTLAVNKVVDTMILPDMNGNGSQEIAALVVVNDDVRVIIRDPALKSFLRSTWYANMNWDAKGFSLINDISGNGMPEISVRLKHKDTGTEQEIIRDADTRQLTGVSSFNWITLP